MTDVSGVPVCPYYWCPRLRGAGVRPVTAQQAGPVNSAQVPFGVPFGSPFGAPFGFPIGVGVVPFPLLFWLLGGFAGHRRRRRHFGFMHADPDLDGMVDDFERQSGALAQAEMYGIPHVVSHDSVREIMGYTMSRIDMGRPVHDVPGMAERITDEFVNENSDLFTMVPALGGNLDGTREAVKSIVSFTLEHHNRKTR